jgi:hypothetical protein
MTPKEKAEELVNKYWDDIPDLFFEEAKECALIAVDLVLSLNDIDGEYSYYLEVKQEIEKL